MRIRSPVSFAAPAGFLTTKKSTGRFSAREVSVATAARMGRSCRRRSIGRLRRLVPDRRRAAAERSRADRERASPDRSSRRWSDCRAAPSAGAPRGYRTSSARSPPTRLRCAPSRPRRSWSRTISCARSSGSAPPRVGFRSGRGAPQHGTEREHRHDAHAGGRQQRGDSAVQPGRRARRIGRHDLQSRSVDEHRGAIHES